MYQVRKSHLPGGALLLGAGLLASVAAESALPEAKPNPFFAFCIDTHDARKRNLEQQAQMLKQLGYAGVGHLWLDNLPERLKTLDTAGLKLFQVTLRVDLTPGKSAYDARLNEMLPLLKGRGTQLALLINGLKPSDPAGDARAVEIVRGMAARAGESGVQIVLYPHAGFWLERLEDAMRIADRVDRPNVGVMFNLCHWLRVSQDRDFRPLLAKARPRLFAVSLNGAESRDAEPGWSRYIQPLGRGSFDVLSLLETLRELGYAGPVGLQCYGIPGDAREHLAESMKAWQCYSERLAAKAAPQMVRPQPQ